MLKHKINTVAAWSYSEIDLNRLSTYSEVSNIRRTLVGNGIIDHADMVGASPVDAAPTASSFSTSHLASFD